MSKYIDAEKLIAKIERQNVDKKVIEPVIRIIDSLQQDETQIDRMLCSQIWWEEQGWIMIPPDATIKDIASLLKQIRKKLQQEQTEISLEKFTDKIETFQGRYKYPEIVSIKGAMAFMARMFYQYPNVARQWYDRLPKTTMD